MAARAQNRFPDRLKAGQLDHVMRGPTAKKLKLSQQYRAMQKGDVARRLQLQQHTNRMGHADIRGHASPAHRPKHYYQGRISPHYAASSFRHHYWGHHSFAGWHWYPHWTSWVNWAWYYNVNPYWDPRPGWCRPVVYVSSPHWTWYRPPVWGSLPVADAGTWVDVQPVGVVDKFDLQMLAVRLVDPGHPEEKLGPRYRVWFRNNSDRPIVQPFDVMLFAGKGEELVEGVPQAGVRVTSIETGDVQAVDVRLPIEAYSMGRDAKGQPVPFETLHVIVDANREIAETSEANNGVRIAREEIPLVDPAAFEVEPIKATAGGEVLLAGEGFGPRPGQLLVHLGGLELEGEILGWYDLGVRATLPNVPLAATTEAELIVVRGDGAAANPIKITVSPAKPPAVEMVPPGPAIQ